MVAVGGQHLSRRYLGPKDFILFTSLSFVIGFGLSASYGRNEDHTLPPWNQLSIGRKLLLDQTLQTARSEDLRHGRIRVGFNRSLFLSHQLADAILSRAISWPRPKLLVTTGEAETLTGDSEPEGSASSNATDENVVPPAKRLK